MTATANTAASAGSYAVIWRRRLGPVFNGRLVLAESSIQLDGTAPGSSRTQVVEIPFDLVESAEVIRDRSSRLRSLPTLTLVLQGSAPLQIAVVGGAGRLRELAAAVTARLVEPTAA
jgi:hypothetical protein